MTFIASEFCVKKITPKYTDLNAGQPHWITEEEWEFIFGSEIRRKFASMWEKIKDE